MNLKSIASVLNNEHGLNETVMKIPATLAAATLLDSKLKEAGEAAEDEAEWLEVGAVALIQSCETFGVGMQDIQMVLNLVRRDVYQFGARDGATWMDQDATVQAMRVAAKGDPIGGRATPIHRFRTELLRA